MRNIKTTRKIKKRKSCSIYSPSLRSSHIFVSTQLVTIGFLMKSVGCSDTSRGKIIGNHWAIIGKNIVILIAIFWIKYIMILFKKGLIALCIFCFSLTSENPNFIILSSTGHQILWFLDFEVLEPRNYSVFSNRQRLASQCKAGCAKKKQTQNITVVTMFFISPQYVFPRITKNKICQVSGVLDLSCFERTWWVEPSLAKWFRNRSEISKKRKHMFYNMLIYKVPTTNVLLGFQQSTVAGDSVQGWVRKKKVRKLNAVTSRDVFFHASPKSCKHLSF